MTRKFATVLVVALSLLFAVPAAQAEPMSLDRCLEEAMTNNAMLKAANLEITVRENQQKSVRGHFLPSVTLDGNAVFWTKPQKFAFDLSFLQDIFADLAPFLPQETQDKLANMAPMEMLVHDDITMTGSVTVGQPLTQLYQIWAGYEAAGQLAEATRMNTQKARRDLQLRVAKAYYGLVTATSLKQTAEAGLKQIEEYERQVQAFMEAEMVEKNALLKVQVQKAEIQKNLFQAQKGVQLAQAALNLYMGRPLEASLEPAVSPDAADPEKLLATPLARQQQLAVDQRPDARAAQYQRSAAEAGRHAAIGAMLPALSAFFKYDYNYGFGELQPEHAVYGGLQLSWTVWEWGATYYKLKEAEVRLDQAREVATFTDEQVKLDVVSKRLDLEEAIKNLDVARIQLEQAEENLRVEQLRYEAQQTTTADLLGAQTLKLKAESDATRALLTLKDASLELLVAMGVDLVEKG